MRIAALRKLLGMLLGLGALAVVVPAAASAAAVVYNVNTTADGNLTPSGSVICAAPTDAGTKCTLRAAVEATNNQPSGTPVTINVPKGTYKLTVLNPSSTSLYLDVKNNGPLKIVGAGAPSTIVDANFSDRGFLIENGDVTISKITVENGRTGDISGSSCPGSPPAEVDGGGILEQRGPLTLLNDVLTHNIAPGFGGAIDDSDSSSNSLKLTNTTVSHNTACTSSNGLGNSGGGGVAMSGGGGLTIKHSTITHNTAAQSGDGGGVATLNGSDGPATIIDTTISGNTASGDGGGIAAEGGGTFTLFADLLSANTTSGVGGGLFNGGDTNTFTNTTITGNEAADGGGIFEDFGDDTLHFSTVTDNTASSGTGNLAVFSETPGAPVKGADAFTLDDTIVARGHGTTANNCGGGFTPGAGFNDNDFNLFDDTADSGAQCGHTSSNTHDHITSNPKLGSLADNGGPTKTEALLSGSPAIDAASDGTCQETENPTTAKAVDQREIVPRPQGPHCDIGAFEATPDLGLSGSADTNPITVGDQDTVTYVIDNSGPEMAQGSTFTDPAAGAGYKIDSVTTSQGTCTHTAKTVSCHLGTIPTGGTVTVKIVLTGLTPGKIKLHGFTNTSGFDSLDLRQKNNHATVEIRVNPKAKPVVVPTRPSISIAPLGPACHAESSTIHISATAKAPAGIRRVDIRVNLVGGGQAKAFGYAPPPGKTVKKKTVHLDLNGPSLLAGRTYSVNAKVVDKLNRSATDHTQFTMCKHHKKRGFTG